MKEKIHKYKFKSEVWIYSGGKAEWYFVTLPKNDSDEIKFWSAGRKAGWGSVRIKAKIGKTEWETSVFPERGSGCFILPLKAMVRKAEKITEGKVITVTVAHTTGKFFV